MAKNYIDTFMYRQYPKYEKQLFEFIMKADRIDTKSEAFADILFDVKRRKVSDALTKIIQSDNVILGINEGSTLPKTFKVFTAKDLRKDKSKIKVFIDCTGVVQLNKGVYTCDKLEWLISYVIDAMVSFIYTMMPNKLIGNSSIMRDGGEAFSTCFTYIIDRMYKISSVLTVKQRIQYLSLIYWQCSILCKDFDSQIESIRANAAKICGIEKRDAAMVDVLFEAADFVDINTFVKSLSKLNLKDINIGSFTSYWMNAFGTGTVLATEYFPSFSAMLTDAYMGGYLNNQITIEKLTGTSMISFSKSILQIGSALA